MTIARVPPLALVLVAFVLVQGAAPLMTTPLVAQARIPSWTPGDSLIPGQDYPLSTESLRRWARTTRALAKASRALPPLSMRARTI